MKKAILTIAVIVALFVAVADMPGASLMYFVTVKGASLASLAYFSKRLEKILPDEEV